MDAEAQSGPGDGRFLNLLATLAHVIPAMILLALGLALLGLGVLDMVAPATFDQIGGGFLKVLFREPSS